MGHPHLLVKVVGPPGFTSLGVKLFGPGNREAATGYPSFFANSFIVSMRRVSPFLISSGFVNVLGMTTLRLFPRLVTVTVSLMLGMLPLG